MHLIHTYSDSLVLNESTPANLSLFLTDAALSISLKLNKYIIPRIQVMEKLVFC